MSKVAIIIPAFNEESSISDVISGIRKATKNIGNMEIIVVDDGSKDKTNKIASSIKGIKLITHSRNRGYGASIKTGIMNTDAEYIMIMDADSTYPPTAVPLLLKESRKYDMVVGSREGKNVNIPFFRRIAKFIIKHFAQNLTKTKIPDLNSGLRVFKKELAQRFMRFFPDGFSFTSTITIACLTNDYTLKYIPINYYKRRGSSTVHPIKDFIGFIVLISRLTIYFKPLNVFMPASVVLFLLGVAKLTRDFILLDHFGLGGALLVITALNVAIFGVLADLINKRTSI